MIGTITRIVLIFGVFFLGISASVTYGINVALIHFGDLIKNAMENTELAELISFGLLIVANLTFTIPIVIFILQLAVMLWATTKKRTKLI